MKKKQVRNLVLSLALVGAIGGGATLALLTAQSETVTNTFTVGKGLHDKDITLDEAPVDSTTGQKKDGPRVQENTYKDLEQGDVLDKDPSVTIAHTAADCYVFVQISNLIDSPYYSATIKDCWKPVEEKENVYVYSDANGPKVVSGGLTTTAGNVFDGLTIKDDAPLYTVNDGVVSQVELPKIIVKACAVQATNSDYEKDVLPNVTFK